MERITILGQPGEKTKFARPHLSGKKLGGIVHTCHPSNCRKLKTGSGTRQAWTKSQTQSPK
jgi:hypothetical protein